MGRLEFDGDTLPWLDRPYREIDAYMESLDLDEASSGRLRDQLIHWMRFGFVAMQGLIEPEYIDAYLSDVDELCAHPERYSVELNVEGRSGMIPAREVVIRDLPTQRFRICDFHNSSVAGKLLSLHPAIVEMLEHIFRDTLVAMQTLTFLFGSEQHLHQDFAYVVPEIPSHLAATWIALEDVRLDAGPLGYMPGSHSIPKFDFGDGMFLSPESERDELDFRDHIEAATKEAGIEERVFEARKGDVFFWHSALAHRGTVARQPGITRKSLVTHYSTASAYRADRRATGETPIVQRVNGGIVYQNPLHAERENELTIGLEQLRRSRPDLVPDDLMLTNLLDVAPRRSPRSASGPWLRPLEALKRRRRLGEP